MSKSILNLKGVQLLNKTKQQTINGGNVGDLHCQAFPDAPGCSVGDLHCQEFPEAPGCTSEGVGQN